MDHAAVYLQNSPNASAPFSRWLPIHFNIGTATPRRRGFLASSLTTIHKRRRYSVALARSFARVFDGEGRLLRGRGRFSQPSQVPEVAEDLVLVGDGVGIEVRRHPSPWTSLAQSHHFYARFPLSGGLLCVQGFELIGSKDIATLHQSDGIGSENNQRALCVGRSYTFHLITATAPV